MELLAALGSVAVPGSLHFNDNEFQRSPAAAQKIAKDAAKIVQPGDLIFITTSGALYTLARTLANSEYDHVVIVLDKSRVLHVGFPKATVLPLERLMLPQRQPVVLRPNMTDDERNKFLRCAEILIGNDYDIIRAAQLGVRIITHHITGMTPFQKLKPASGLTSWICSDAVLVLLAGCCEEFRLNLVKARSSQLLDVYRHGCASLSDFSRLRTLAPGIFTRISLPVSEYTLQPQKQSYYKHYGDIIKLLQNMKNGQTAIPWYYLQQSIVNYAQDSSKSLFNQQKTIANYAFKSSKFLYQWVKHLDTKVALSDSHKQNVKVLVYVISCLFLVQRGRIVIQVLRQAVQTVLIQYALYQIIQQLHKHLQNKTVQSKL